MYIKVLSQGTPAKEGLEFWSTGDYGGSKALVLQMGLRLIRLETRQQSRQGRFTLS